MLKKKKHQKKLRSKRCSGVRTKARCNTKGDQHGSNSGAINIEVLLIQIEKLVEFQYCPKFHFGLGVAPYRTWPLKQFTPYSSAREILICGNKKIKNIKK